MKKWNLYILVVLVAIVIGLFTLGVSGSSYVWLGIICQMGIIVAIGVYAIHYFTSAHFVRDFSKKVLPLWSVQLSHSVSDSDKQLVDVAKNLDLILEDIKAIKKSSFLGDATSSATDIFDNSKAKLQSIIEILKESTKTKTNIVEQVEEVSKSLGSIDKFIEKIQSFSMQIRVLSTNALIIASRISGEHGNAFAVVADEMCQFSNRVDEISKELNSIIGSFKTTYHMHQADIVSKVMQDMDTVNTLDKELQNTLSELQNFSKNIMYSNKNLEKSTHNIDINIKNSLYMLQFQDRISQIMRHLVEQMDDLSIKLDEQSVEFDLDMYLNELKSQYTTSEQLKAHNDTHKVRHKQDEVINNGDIVFL